MVSPFRWANVAKLHSVRVSLTQSWPISPSGLRGSTQVRISSDAWVQIPLEAFFLTFGTLFKAIHQYLHYNTNLSHYLSLSLLFLSLNFGGQNTFFGGGGICNAHELFFQCRTFVSTHSSVSEIQN